MSNFNKTVGYRNGDFSPYSYMGSDLRKIASSACTLTQRSFNGAEIFSAVNFTYGTDSVYPAFNFSNIGIFNSFAITVPTGTKITADDWGLPHSENYDTRIQTTVNEFILGECTYQSETYIRPNALANLHYYISQLTLGGDGYEEDGKEYQDFYNSFPLTFNLSVDPNDSTKLYIYWAIDYNSAVQAGEYSYNRIYTENKNLRVALSGYIMDEETYKFTEEVTVSWNGVWENPSFFNAELLELDWVTNPVTSGSATNLSFKNPMKMNYSGYVSATISSSQEQLLTGMTFSESGSSSSETSKYIALTPNPKDDWIAAKIGYDNWMESYNAYANITYTIPQNASYLVNTFVKTSTVKTPALTINCNNNFITDFTSAVLTHNTTSYVSAIQDLYVDEKTNITVDLEGVKVPWYTLNNSTTLTFKMVISAANPTTGNISTTSEVHLLSTSFPGSSDIMPDYFTVDGDYLVLTDGSYWTWETTKLLDLKLAGIYGVNKLIPNLTITIVADWGITDSYPRRGSRTMVTSTPVYPYKVPQVSELNGYRYTTGTTSSYEIDETNGTIAGILAVFSLTSIRNHNIFTVHNVKANRTDQQTYIWTQNISNNTRLYVDNPALDIDYSYVITLTLTDALGSTVTSSFTIASGKTFLDFKAGGNGMAIGKAAENDCLEIAMDTVFGQSGDSVTVDFTNANVIGISGSGSSMHPYTHSNSSVDGLIQTSGNYFNFVGKITLSKDSTYSDNKSSKYTGRFINSNMNFPYSGHFISGSIYTFSTTYTAIEVRPFLIKLNAYGTSFSTSHALAIEADIGHESGKAPDSVTLVVNLWGTLS